MITITNKLTFDITKDILLPYNPKDIALFDIETTGLSPVKHMIYMIGILTYNVDTWTCTQYLATNLEDEKDMLRLFFKLIKDKTYIIHFNGSTFDIPFINKRSNFHHIDSILKDSTTITSVDLYKIYRSYSKLLKYENYKLTTIEQHLGIHRKDRYNGKELIKTYMEFIKFYSLDILKNDYAKSDTLKANLLLHNYEDIINLIPLLKIVHLTHLKQGNICIIDSPSITPNNKLTINGTLIKDNQPYSVPHKLNILFDSTNLPFIDDSINIVINNSTLTIEASIIDDELKFFYNDYKNYYYLPLEDTAVHKSVGTFVDKDHRVQAKAATCYVKKNSSFIKTSYTNSTHNTFKRNFADSNLYIEVNDLLKEGTISLYVQDLLSSLF